MDEVRFSVTVFVGNSKKFFYFDTLITGSVWFYVLFSPLLNDSTEK